MLINARQFGHMRRFSTAFIVAARSDLLDKIEKP